MSQDKIDLSQLPPQVRQQVEQMLAKMPAEMRKQVLESPMLRKIVERVEKELRSANAPQRVEAAKAVAKKAAHAAHAIAQRPPPRGHYNATIQPGDRVSLQRWVILLMVVGVVIWVAVNF